MFNENGDRQGLTQIEQLQGDDEVQVAVYNPSSPFTNKISWHAHQPLYWKGLSLLIIMFEICEIFYTLPHFTVNNVGYRKN